MRSKPGYETREMLVSSPTVHTNLKHMSDTNATDQAIRTRLSSIFPNEQVREKVIKLVTEQTERPEGWGDDSHSPYYKKFFGEEMKELADDQLKTYREIIYDYQSFCRPWKPGGISEQTLYNRVNQSRRYLVEKMDDDKATYINWRDITRTERRHGVGVVIYIIPEIKAALMGNTSEMPKPRMAESMANKPRWKQEMDQWIESSATGVKVIKNLILDPQEQELIKAELSGDRTIEFLVTSSEIRLMRINPESV